MSKSNLPNPETDRTGGLSRRDMLAVAGAAGLAAVVPGGRAFAAEPAATPTTLPAPPNGYTLPPLAYATDALEPVIDRMTMEIHHGKHHKAYVDNANKALAGTALAGVPAAEVVKRLAEVPADKRAMARNNVGGHLNHTLFWAWMTPPSHSSAPPSVPALPAAMSANLLSHVNTSFGSTKTLQEKFTAAAMGRFGSGWAWLVVTPKGELQAVSTANQDNPLMGQELAGVTGVPILGVDVWEHAYYLKYQNRRVEYLAAWWSIVNWSRVSELHALATADK